MSSSREKVVRGEEMGRERERKREKEISGERGHRGDIQSRKERKKLS